MEILYKDESELIGNDFIRRQIDTKLIGETQDENKKKTNEIEDNTFWMIPSDIDEFNQLTEEGQKLTLKHLKEDIKISYERNEVSLTEDIFIKSDLPNLICDIIQDTLSTDVLELAYDIIDNWIYYKFNPNVWYNEELLIYILIHATSKSENISPGIFESCVNILIKFLSIKKDDIMQFFNLGKVMNRIINSFEKNNFFNTRNLLVQLLNSIFTNISQFDVKDALILGDIFNSLENVETLDYFQDLMECALTICEKSKEFTYNFVSNVNINSIFKQISEVPIESQFSIINLIYFFLQTKDPTLIESIMPEFEWSYILPILENTDDDYDKVKTSILELAAILFIVNPELADKEGAKEIIIFFCQFMNNDNYKSKQSIIECIYKLISVQNANIAELLIDQNFISYASDFLSAAEGLPAKYIIDSIHYIAQYAENFALRQVIEQMAATEIFALIPDLAKDPIEYIAEAAQALLNDESLTLFRSYLDPE